MNILDMTWGDLFGKLFKPQVKENPVNKVILATLPKNEIWTPRDYAGLSEAGYKNCMTAFSCINKISRNAAGIKWQVENAKGDELENHPCLLLIKRPNPQQGQRAFVEQVLSYLLLTGNTYIYVATGGGRPWYLYSLRPDRMKVLPGNGFDLIGGYRYSVNGQMRDFKPDEILHIKFFNPLNDFYGMGPVEAAARGIDIANYADVWNAAIIKNDMKPPGAFSTEGALTQDQFDRIKDQIEEQYMGYDNAGRPLLLEGGLKFTPFSMTAKELDWINSNKANLRNICAVFEVPSQLMGDTEASTYSNYQEARKALFTETVLPMMERFTDDLNNWLLPMYGPGLELKIDTEQIEILQENRTEKFTYLATADWLTVNEKRLACGYDDIGPDADVVLVPMGKIPLMQAVAEPEPIPEALQPGNEPIDSTAEEEEEDEDEDEGKSLVHKAHHWSNIKRREMLWKSFDIRVKAREKTFENIAKEYLRRQAEGITKRVENAGSLGSLSPESILGSKREIKRYIEVFSPWYRDHFLRAFNAGIEATKGHIFDDAEFKATNKPTSWVTDMTEEQEQALKKLIADTAKNVTKTQLEKIESLLEQANENNWTINELASKLSERVFNLVQWRAALWARTESAKIDNYGQVQGYKEIKFVEKKGWMCSFLPDSRDAHIEADGQERKLDEDFNIGGQPMAYPGDPKGRPGNTCNCACSTYPIVGEI